MNATITPPDLAKVYRMSTSQLNVYLMSDGSLSYWCGSTHSAVIAAYRERVMDFLNEHPEFDEFTAQAALREFGKTLNPKEQTQ